MESAGPTAVRLAGAWLVGAFVAPTIATSAVLGLWASSLGDGGTSAVYAGIIGVVAVLAIAAFAGLETTTAGVRGARAGRTGRGVIVLVVGGVLWSSGAWLTIALGAPLAFPGVPALVLGGLPFALVSALLCGGRTAWVAGGAAAALAVLGVVAAPAVADHRADEVLQEHDAADRDLMYELAVPGYGPPWRSDDDRILWFDPTDPLPADAASGGRRIYVSTYRGTFDCASAQLNLPVGRDDRPSCTEETPGRWFLTGAVPTGDGSGRTTHQQYVRQDGGTVVTVGASDAVPRVALRDAVLAAHRATDDDLRRLAGTDG